MRRVMRVSAGLGMAVLLAACGSTVATSRQVTVGGQAGVGGSDGLGGVGTTGGTNATGSNVGGVGSVGGSGTNAAGSATKAAGPAYGGASSTSVLGSSTKPIQVGIAYVKDAAAGFQALGIQGATLGDMHLYAQILVDDINAHGGLGGRKIVPIYFGYDVNPGSQPYEQQDAQACSAFTQDNHVEVAIVNFAGQALDECLRQRGIPMLEDGPTGGVGAATLKKDRQLFILGGLNLDRRAKEQVRALVRESYFTAWDSTNGKPGVAPTRIGIVTYSKPDYTESVNGPLVQGIVAAGYPKPMVVEVTPHDSYQDLSNMEPQIGDAILAFRAAGVTHVIIWDDNGVASLFFMQQAENQKYRPRYGINSGNNMQVLAKLVSANQLSGSIGMGWDPLFDIPAAKSPTSPWSNSARRACYALMQKKNAASGTGFNENSAMMYCSVFAALKNRWDSMAQPSAAGLVTAIESYGSTFVDPQVPLTFLSPTHHDGAAGVYDYLYDGSCGCMVYRGGIHPLLHS